MKNKIIMSLLVLILNSCSLYGNQNLLGDDFRLFENTIAWPLAVAVENEDTAEIRKQIVSLKIPVDFKEKKYGQTLLMLAVQNNKEKSVAELLSLGADPNTTDDKKNCWGQNAVLMAARFIRPSVKILNLLLDFGGNPNSTECGMTKDNLGNDIKASSFALYEAVFIDFEKVKLLIAKGADVNYQTDTTKGGAAQAAFYTDRIDILYYLITHGYNVHSKFSELNLSDNSTIDVDICHKLRYSIFPIDSFQYKYKLLIIKELSKRGIDYRSSKIPESAIDIIKNDEQLYRSVGIENYLKTY